MGSLSPPCRDCRPGADRCAGSQYYRSSASTAGVMNSDIPWLYACGIEGPASIKVKLGPDTPKTYQVILHFAEPSHLRPGERVFDVKLQGAVVFRDLDVAKEAGAPSVALVKSVSGVAASSTLTLELVPKTGRPPILSALELHRE
ncbi:MAG: malectin domain-containing carbohydrate-binding protein [Candidatus Zipacnadales bacterium]